MITRHLFVGSANRRLSLCGRPPASPACRVRTYEHVDALRIILQILLVLTSFLVVVLVLLHKGKGGGLSDMFGGGISSNAGSSGVAERNLNRLTIGLAVLWAVVIVLLGLIQRVSV